MKITAKSKKKRDVNPSEILFKIKVTFMLLWFLNISIAIKIREKELKMLTLIDIICPLVNNIKLEITIINKGIERKYTKLLCFGYSIKPISRQIQTTIFSMKPIFILSPKKKLESRIVIVDNTNEIHTNNIVNALGNDIFFI